MLKSKAIDVASERAVLSGLIRFGGAVYIDVAEILDADSFTQDSNKAIWAVLKSIYEKKLETKIDIAIFFSEAQGLGLSGHFNQDIETKYVKTLFTFGVEQESVLPLAQKIKKLEIARLLQTQANKASKDLDEITGHESIESIISAVETPIFECTSRLNSVSSEGIIHIKDGFDEYLKNIEDDPTTILGIPTGFSAYDEQIGGGLLRGGVSIVGARPKTGKSAMLDNIALHVAGKHKIPVLNLDTEMSANKHRPRMLAMLTDISINDIKTGRYASSALQKRKVNAAKDYLCSIPYYYIPIAGTSFDEVIAITRRWLLRNVGYDSHGNIKDCLIMLDYLKLMDQNDLKSMAEHQAIGFKLMALNNLCIRYHVPCLSFVQLNRDGLSKEDTSIISQSDRIAWFADNFSVLKEKSEEEIEQDGPENGNRKLQVIIARDGEGGDGKNYINLNFTKATCKFTQGKTKYELMKPSKSKGFEIKGGDEEISL